MHLVQLLLPTRDRDGQQVADGEMTRIRRELVDRFGGVTAYARSPASGAWVSDEGRVERDDVVIVEVMVDSLDRDWWRGFAMDLARRLGQKEIAVRALPMDDLSARP